MRKFLNGQWFNNNQFKKRLFLSYILVLLPPLVVMGFLSYWWMSNILSNQVEKSYQTMIGSVRDNVDKRFEELYEFSLQLAQTQWVSKLMYMQGNTIDRSRINNFELTGNCDQLKGYDAVNEFIITVSIVFPEKQFVVSSLGIADTELYFDEIRKLENINLNDWQGILNTLERPAVLNPGLLSSRDRPQQKVLTYICPLPSLDQKNHATLVTYIKDDTLVSLLKGLSITEDSSIYILNDEGAVISSLNPQDQILSGLDLDSDRAVSENSNIYKIHGNKFFIFCYKSNINNWRYLVAVPYGTVMEKVEYIRVITILLGICLSMAGLMISYGLTVKNYRPLSKLMDTIKGRSIHKYNALDMNEFDFLRRAVLSILSEEDLLREQFDKQKPIIRNTYLLKLLNGNMDERETTPEKLELMGLYYPYRFFIVGLFVLNQMKTVDEVFLQRIAEDGERLGIVTGFTEIDGKKKALILNFDDMQCITDFILSIKARVESELQVKCIIGVGKVYPSLIEIRDSYREAVIALDYKLINDDTDIIFFEKLKTVNSNIYYYPIDKEVQILNELRIANYRGVMDIVREVVAFNTGIHSLSIINARCLFYDLMGTALKALSSLNIVDLVDISQEQINNLKTLVEMQSYLDNVYRKICDYIGHNKKSHNGLLKSNIKVFIDDNYSNPDLSLAMIANAMDISVSHLCKFFKEQFGCNFLDYLNRKRIERAKELFNGHFTVNQIAQAVGYNNDITFRRVFKKYEGVTPGKISCILT